MLRNMAQAALRASKQAKIYSILSIKKVGKYVCIIGKG